MVRLQSEKVIIDKPAQEVSAFLSDFNNVGTLMPEQVENYIVENDTCSFTIKGMAKLGLAYEQNKDPNEIVMRSHGKVPFDFKLISRMEEKDNKTELQLFLDADLNPFLKMMAEKPLTNFLNLLARRYQEKG